MIVSIVDGSNKIYSLMHAMGADGPIIDGMIGILKRIYYKYNPNIIIVAWEGNRSFREDLMNGYKRERNPLPDHVYDDSIKMREVMKAIGIPQVCLNNYEADDVIATMVNKLSKMKDSTIYVHTDDKDMYQCVTCENIIIESRVSKIGKKYDGLLTCSRLKEQFGFDMKYFHLYQWMVGDNTDNIPGINGVGPVGATTFICEMGELLPYCVAEDCVEYVRNYCSNMNRKVRNVAFKILADKDALWMWDMVKLVNDLSIEMDCRVYDNIHSIISKKDLSRYLESFSGYKDGAMKVMSEVEEYLI